MDDDDGADSNYSDYKTYCAGNDLDVDRCLCLNNINARGNFAGSNEDFGMLSKDGLTITDWKKSNNDMNFNFNSASEEMHAQIAH